MDFLSVYSPAILKYMVHFKKNINPTLRVKTANLGFSEKDWGDKENFRNSVI